MPFAAAMSEHPLTAHAVGEVTGAVLERIGDRPDFATVFVTPPHAGALEDVMRTVEEVLHPLVLAGLRGGVRARTASRSGAGRGRSPCSPGTSAPWCRWSSMRCRRIPDDGLVLRGWPAEIPFTPEALVLVGRPLQLPGGVASWPGWTPITPACGWWEAWPPRRVARGATGSRSGTRVRTGGAVGVFLGPGAEVATLVSQGCRPFGDPLVVTRAEHNLIYELAGRPALEQVLTQARDSLNEEEVVLLETGGLHLGRVIDEHREHFGRGDFLVRNVVGADRDLGCDRRRGRRGAGHDRAIPSPRRARPPTRTCTRWSRRAGPTPPSSSPATAGARGCSARRTTTSASCPSTSAPCPWPASSPPGSSGPVGGRNFVHGFTASVALLRDRSGDPDVGPGTS